MKTTPSNLIKNITFFSELNQNELAELDALFRVKQYKKGTVLFHEDDYGEELFIIEKGTVKIYKEDHTRETILAILKEGDSFGEMGVLQYNEHRSANAETLEACTLYTLHRADFTRILEKNPSIALKLLDMTMNRLRKANRLIKNLTTLDARTRILKTLIDLAEEYGAANGAEMVIDLKLTHQQIADMSGVVRETVTKVLLELQTENIISINQKKIAIQKMASLEEKVNI